MPYANPEMSRAKALERYEKNKPTRKVQMRFYAARPEVKAAEKIRNQERTAEGYHAKYYRVNRDAVLAKCRKYRLLNPVRQLWSNAQQRSKKFGLPFDISPDDIIIPKTCPVFGKKLVLGNGRHYPWAPSLDRVKPELGYVKGNIQVISHRANMLKGNASVKELEMLVNWLKRITFSTTSSLL